MLRHLPLLFALSITIPAAAQYDRPESVEYDPVGDRYFVSSTLDHTIKVLSTGGVVTDFVTGLANEPYGLEILGDTLYACLGSTVKGFALSDGAQVSSVAAGGGTNGLATDGTYLYTALFSAADLVRIDPSTGVVSVLNANTGAQPSGLVYDPTGDRIVLVFWGSNAEIKGYDPITGTETVLVANTGLANLDGVTIDCNGNFLVSSWAPDRITSYEPTFTMPGVDLVLAGLDDPSDIDYDETNQLLCIPNNGPTNNVLLVPVSGCGVGVEEHAEYLSLHPNPVIDRLIVPARAEERVSVFDVNGRELAVRMERQNGRMAIDTQDLPAGVYSVRITGSTRARVGNFVKE